MKLAYIKFESLPTHNRLPINHGGVTVNHVRGNQTEACGEQG